MGTYTTNYNLFMPTVGEQGWGDLINGNFSNIDTTMKNLSNSIATLETEADSFDSRIGILENTIPEEGMIIATKTIDAKEGVHGRLYINGILNTTEGTKYASVTSTTQTLTIPNFTGIGTGYGAQGVSKTSSTITVGGSVTKLNDVPYPIKISTGIYIKSDDYVFGDINELLYDVTRTATVTFYTSYTAAGYVKLYVNGKEVLSVTFNGTGTKTGTYEIPIGATCYITAYSPHGNATVSGSLSISNKTKYIYFTPE